MRDNPSPAQALDTPLPPSAPGLALDSRLNPAAMAPAFARFGRAHIPGILQPDAALALHEGLLREDGWVCSTMGSDGALDLPLDGLAALTPDQEAAFLRLAHKQAAHGFHYMFDTLRISDLVEAGEAVSPVLRAAYDLVNSPAFLGFIAALTGTRRGVYADLQATRFRPGHYLTRHDDHREGAGRLCAYVLNLTPHWRADWGGLLTFIDPDGHVAEAYTPAFNALNVLKVPQPHAVSCVAPFADGARLSLTGWVRDSRPAQ